ncbi:hypothetical protein [Nocardia wallacei]|uniref:hypothetical protein n=1 Tax=Nocardia wallacei TaxID=480035 RepID=UPI0024564183|nr:hypothetical protein [Nocardia wallacei]
MRLHRYTIDRAEQNPRADVLHHKSWYLRAYRDGKRDFGLQAETIIQKPEPEFSLRLHVGGRWSETPWDGHLTILGSGIYWGISAFGRLAEWISREAKHKYEGRDLKISIHDSRLWLAIWTHPSDWQKGEFAAWRDRSIKLNPLDILYGERRYWHEDEAHAVIAVRMPEDTYPVKATLQRRKLGRPKARKRIESWTVDVDAPEGIPYCVDRSGGWKGDRAYGFGVDLKDRRADWAIDAQAAIEAWVLKRRADSGFRRPDPVESRN